MKLLFVHQNLGDFGGAEANIHLTARELAARGHTAALLYQNSTGRNESGWRQTFSQTFCLPVAGTGAELQTALDQFEPDLIYLHNFTDLAAVETLLQAGIPVIRMVHDHGLYCMRSYKYNYFTRQICTRAASPYCVFPCLASLARNRSGGWPVQWVSYAQKRAEIQLNQQCQLLIVYSEYQKQELVRNGFDPDRIELCIPIQMLDQADLVSSFSDRNVILFAGQIIRGKGVDVLLRALARIQTPFHCHLLGDGNHRAYCERLARRLGLGERVRFQGYVPPAELRSFYRQASVFVMSSLWPEPFGMAGPEAMRYGLPVVAFAAGGIPEWLRDGENGFLVPWKNIEQFACRIEELLQDKALARQMGRRGMEGVKQYDSAQQIDRLAGLFERVLCRTHPSRIIRRSPPQLALSTYD